MIVCSHCTVLRYVGIVQLQFLVSSPTNLTIGFPACDVSHEAQYANVEASVKGSAPRDVFFFFALHVRLYLLFRRQL